MADEQLVHICEVCGVEKVMTPEEAFQEGWDYPPGMGQFGTLSPRTCGNCGIDKTLWWRIVNYDGDKSEYPLTEADRALIERVLDEPESIRPKPEEKEKE